MTLITQQQQQDYADNGYLLLSSFYCRFRQIDPILEGIRVVIELLCRKYGVEAPTDTPDHAMTKAFMALIKTSRAYGGEVYDAVKQIPEFMQLVCDSRNAELFKELRLNSWPGLAAGGYGIRIDCPLEQIYRAPWHQEFPVQLRSLDGVVYWTPLVEVRPTLGPVQICAGSHRDGFVPVYSDDESGQQGAYALRLIDEHDRLSRYEHRAPLTKPGDLLLMDFLTLHQSGQNCDAYPRWSIQFRYFNFFDPVGIKISWKRSLSEGENLGVLINQNSISS